MQLHDYEQLHPHVRVESISFLTPNTHCAWRVDTLQTKEPDTYEWIRRMDRDAVFFDVGANMGQYSLLAAKRGLTVHSFEPESQNFALMCRNFGLNHALPGKMTPWPFALTDHINTIEQLHVNGLMPGGSCHSFKESVDHHLKTRQFAFAQGCFGTTLDAMAVIVGQQPAYIKIDVDGFEHKVLDGATWSLQHAQSVLVELNTALPEHQAIIEKMAGFGLQPDMATAEVARRKEGTFKGVGNVIFFRDEAKFLSKKAEK